LTTALYFKGDDFLYSDAVFGVKASLVVELKKVQDEKRSKQLGFPRYMEPFWLCSYDIVLPTLDQVKKA